MEAQFSALLKRLEAVTTKLESGATAAPPPPAAPGAPAAPVDDERPTPMVLAFDDFLHGTVAAYVAAAEALALPEVRTALTNPRRLLRLTFVWV